MGEPAIVAQVVHTSAVSQHEFVSNEANAFRHRGIENSSRSPSQVAHDQMYTAEPFEDPTLMPVLSLWSHHAELDLTKIRSVTQVLSAFLFLFCSWGIIGCYGTFFLYFKDVLLMQHSASDVAWIGSTQQFLAIVVGIMTSKWVDYGYMYAMCTVGSILIVFGIMMNGQGTTYVHIFFSHGVCVGLGAGLIYLPCITCCSEYYNQKRGVALGLATLGSSLGSLIYPIMFNKLQPNIGYAWTMRTIGFLVMGLFLVALLLVRPRSKVIESRRLFASRVFKDPVYVVFVLGYFLGNIGLYVPPFFLPSFGKHHEFSDAIFPFTTSFLKTGGILGRLLSILLTKRIGVFGLYVPRTFSAALLAFVWIAVRQQGSFVVVVVLYGFFSGSLLSSIPMIVTKITDEESDINIRLCIASLISSVGSLIGSPVAASLLDIEPPNYLRAQIFAGVFIAVSGLCMFAVRMMKAGSNWLDPF